jgi:hypothetical protein
MSIREPFDRRIAECQETDDVAEHRQENVTLLIPMAYTPTLNHDLEA